MILGMGNLKCQIQWIDEQGNRTPDENDAVAMAVPLYRHQNDALCAVELAHVNSGFVKPHCSHPLLRDTRGGIPICAEHLQRMKPDWEWLVEPLPTE